MERVTLSNKVFTDSPLLDEIVYNARQIVYGGLTIKDIDLADNSETMESAQAGDLLLNIASGTIHFSNFQYDVELLSKYYTDPAVILKYSLDNDLIPQEDREALLTIAVNHFTENYVEMNNYYRMVHGEPHYDSSGIYQGLIIDTREINVSTPTSTDYIYISYPSANDEEKKYYSPIHQLSVTQKNILYNNGTCWNIVNDSDKLDSLNLTKNDVLYVLHIGDREVDYTTARKAPRFGLLYCPSCSSEQLESRFQDLFDANRLYLLYTVYSEAYKHRSDYYDNFMMVFLTIQTVIDLIIELPEYIIRRDIFDTRTCKYIFEANGVKYFKDIPLKYQISLVKNLNRLIKFKSTDKCIVDIVSIFGAESIEVFKYYILKDRLTEKPTELKYLDYKKEVRDTSGNTVVVDDNDKNYDLKFIKVPILDKYDNYIRDNINVYTYDTLTNDDNYWIGDKDLDTVKQDIKDLDFTVLRSKYYSIEAVIDLAKRNFFVTYFMNILMYNNVDKTALQITLPNISTLRKFDIENVIITLFTLSYIYYGVEDTIIDSRQKTSQILGFNLEANLSKISAWLEENHKGLTLKEMHVDTFQTGENGIMSYNELKNLFFTNKDCYDHVVKLLVNPPSKEIYDAYKYIYKSMMITNRNMECFVIGDKSIVEEYKQQGYKSKFINIPRKEQYTNPDDYTRDYNWLIASLDSKDLCFDLSDDFDEDHLFTLYIKDEDNKLAQVGTAQMAYTYKEYLQQKDEILYAYILDIQNIQSVDLRQEACINAIQTIVSRLKDYIDQDGDDAIPLDSVLAGLPSISPDFIKQYVSEVVDFFKSFKIFTKESSIIYVITGKFENYVQLIEHILLKYIFEKSELIKIEDALGGKIQLINGKLVYSGNGIQNYLSADERHALIDKVWLDISTWVYKNYPEYYNSDNYTQIDKVIRDYYEYTSTHTFDEKVMEERYIPEIQSYAVEAILQMIVDVSYMDKVNVDSSIILHMTHQYNEFYREWLIDLIQISTYCQQSEYCLIEDDMTRSSISKKDSLFKIIDKIQVGSTRTINDSITISEAIDMIPISSNSGTSN